MKIFLDSNASTRVDDAVLEAMIPYFTDFFSPPSSDYGHSFGIEAKQALDSARATIAKKINAEIKEIVFTSGQTESNNHAIKGLAFSKINADNKLLIASSVSHSSVLDTMHALEKYGFTVKVIDVDSKGNVKREHLIQLLQERPILVSVPHANVEIGTIEDIKELTTICHEYKTMIHIDATFSFSKIPIDVKEAGIDLLTMDGHLLHGPKGAGALFIRRGIKVERLLDGGLQENTKRGGTENIPGIVGFAKAVSLYTSEVIKQVKDLRDYLWDLLDRKLPNFDITGSTDRNNRLPNHLSFVIAYIEGESILLHLDMLGFMIATGSACSSKKLKASHVLTAIGLPQEISHGSVRIGLSKYNTREEIEQFVEQLVTVVKRLREMSPLNAEMLKEWMEMKERGEVAIEDDHYHDIIMEEN